VDAMTTARVPRRNRTTHIPPTGRALSSVGSWSISTVRRTRTPMAAAQHDGEQYSRAGRPRPL
jgi:hypothetical protein